MTRRILAFAFGIVVGFAGATAAATLYAVQEAANGQFFVVNPATAATSPVGALNGESSLSGLAFDTSTGTMYISDFCGLGCPVPTGLGAIDLTTGQATYIGGHVITSNVFGIAYDSANDILYGADFESGGLVTLNRGTGAATVVGSFGIQEDINDLAYDAATDTLYAASLANLYTIDRTTGAATLVGPFVNARVESLAFDASTDTLYAGGAGPDAANQDLFTVDTGTGTATLVAGTGGPSLDAIEFAPAPSVIEIPTLGPTALVLLTLLVAIVGATLLRGSSH